MNEMIKVTMNENQEPIVSGRELHQILEVDSNYTTWFNRMSEYGFTENIDYITCFPNLESESHGGQNKTDHLIKLDMAKEIAMIQRSDRGKSVRQYFIQVEKEYNSPEKIMARALLMANNTITQLQLAVEEKDRIIEEQKPKYLFGTALSASESSILIGEYAKILKQNGLNIGQNSFFGWLRDKGYLCKEGDRYNKPSEYSMKLKIMEYSATVISHPNGTRTKYTPRLTAKGQEYFAGKFQTKFKPRDSEQIIGDSLPV